jgi:hypothetical protein
MNSHTRAALQELVNQLLLTVPQNFEFDQEKGKVAVDYHLVDKGIFFTDEYFSIVMNGTIHLVNKSNRGNTYFNTMPIHNDDGAEIQIMLSEYSINSALLTAVELDIINFKYTEQSSTTVEAVIADFERAFGQVENVTIVATANPNIDKYSPNVKISPGGNLLEFYIDIHIKNPFDERVDSALITAKLVTNISF